MSDFEDRVRRSLATMARTVPSETGHAGLPRARRALSAGSLAVVAALLVIAVPVAVVAWLSGDGSDVLPVTSPTTPVSSASSPTTSPSTSSPTESPQPPVTKADRELARAFVVFAKLPSEKTAGQVPFAATGVQIGLGPHVLTTLRGQDLTDPSAWSVRYKQGYWRGRVGAFSALETLSARVPRGDVENASTVLDHLTLTVGEHPHCASPPVPAPDSLTGMRRVSIQPATSTISSCIQWFTVDLFVDSSGRVVGVTVDFWEP